MLSNLFASLRATTFLLLLIGFATNASVAQVQYANAVVGQGGIVSLATDAVDSNLSTNATIKPALLLSTTRLRVSFPSNGQAGKPAGFYLRPGNLVNATLLGGAIINTYLKTGNTTTKLESYLLSNNLLSLVVQASGLTKVSFNPVSEFNQIELVYASVLSLGEDIEIYEAFSTVSPLPVQLTAFSGKATTAGVALSWATASEQRNDHFVVERADNTPDEFRPLAQVAGLGTSTQGGQYQFVDAAPARLSYYRLRQVDFDGTESFSPVVAVQAVLTTLAAYPNPATESLTVTGPAGTHFELLNQLGQRIQSADISPTQVQQLDVRSLPNGVYLLRNATTGQSTRVIKATGL